MKLSTANKVWIGLGIFGLVTFTTVYSVYSYAVHGVYDKVKLANLDADSKWAEVVNQYQRRADLIPNLVAIVGQAAGHEHSTLKDVIAARSRAGTVQLTPEALKDPQAMAQFSRVQGDITTALSRMMMLTENYPQLKVNENFLNVQAQLEGTENRITVARNRYIESVKTANIPLVTFWGGIFGGFFDLTERPQFTVDDVKSVSVAPKIEPYKEPK